MNQRDVVLIERPKMIVGQFGATGPSLVVLSTGEHVPVVDVAFRFGVVLEGARGEVPGKAVVVRDDGGLWAFLVEQVSPVLRIPTDRVLRLPEALALTTGSAVEALVDLGSECVPLLTSSGHDSHANRRATDTVEDDAHSCAEPDLVTLSTGLSGEDGAPVAFGVCASRVRAVCTPPLVHRVPGLASHVAGVSSWRGEVIPVVDLAVRFGFVTAPQEAFRLVVVRGPWTVPSVGVISVTMPVVVRASDTRLRLHASQRLEAPNWGVFDAAGTTVIIPDLSRLLTREELTTPLPEGGRTLP